MQRSSASSRQAEATFWLPRGEQNQGAESELEVLFGIVGDGLVLYDASGQVRLVNEAAWQLLGVEAEGRAGMRDCYAFGRLLLRRLQAPRPWQAPWELWKGNGPERERLELAGGLVLERLVQPVLDAAGRPCAWFERYRDCTADDAVPPAWQQVEKMVAVGQMVAGIAHDLNNPLTAILGYAQLLGDRVQDPEARADLEQVAREAERAAALVRSLLVLVRRARAESTQVDLNELVQHTCRLCNYELRRTRIELRLDLDPALPSLTGNPVQLLQALTNLVLNSLQAIASSGVGNRICVRTRHDVGRVFLEVEDNGPGIPVELQQRVFEPFFTTKPPGMGTGLGLAVVSRVVREHGGEISLVSYPGAGATFTLILPVRTDTAATPPSAVEQTVTKAIR